MRDVQAHTQQHSKTVSAVLPSVLQVAAVKFEVCWGFLGVEAVSSAVKKCI